MERIDLNHPITEDDIVNFLVASPDFFERHADVLSVVTLTSPHGNRAVSLQERQAQMLREKIKALEARIVEMVRHAHENARIAGKLEQWAGTLLRADEPADLPALVTRELRHEFDVPQVALKVWDVDELFVDAPFARGASEDAKVFAASLTGPFCGANPGFEVVDWLDDPRSAASIALIPLRWQARAEATVAAPAAVTGPDVVASAAVTDPPVPLEPSPDGRIDPTLTDDQDGGDPDPARLMPAAPEPENPASEGPEPACGLLVLASPDAKRFQSGMGTEFLERISELAGAALSRLRVQN